MRSILTTAPLENRDWKIYQKSDFMFGDAAPDTNQQLLAGEGEWIFTVNGEKYYLPSSKRHFPLSFFQCVTRLRKMNLVHMGVLTVSSHGYTKVGYPLCILGLHPENVLQDIPVEENPAMAQTFGNQFLKARDNYPAMDFRVPGWIHPPKAWWKNLTQYILAYFGEDLERLGLREAVRTTCYGIQISVANFYAILE